jgi:hypothetical protein
MNDQHRSFRLSRSSRLGLGVAFAVTAAALGVAAPASADEAADTATARSLGIEGVTLANAGNCKDAVEKLERAERLHHAPTTATRLGECEIEMGKLVRGTERLQRVIREPLAANAHAAFGAAVARAHKVLDAALPRIATLRIKVDAPPGTRLAVSVDDEPTSDAVVDTDRPIDPGTHTIKVSAEGFLAGSVTAALEEGQTKSVLVELHPDPDARKRARAGEAGPGAAGAHGEGRGSKAPAIVAFGAGALGLGLGIYAAVVVDDKKSALSSQCDADRVCPTELQRDIRDAKTWATVSTVGFATAGVGVATGLVLLLVSGSGSGSGSNAAANANAKAQASGLRMRPTFGATSVGVDGVF